MSANQPLLRLHLADAVQVTIGAKALPAFNDKNITPCRGCSQEVHHASRIPRQPLNLRIQPELRGLIDRAAALTGKTRTDFVLNASRRAAEEALLDRAVFGMGEEAYREFLARLDMSPRPNERLRRTMSAPPPWDGA